MPTKAEFIKRADAICERTDKKQEVGFDAYFDKHPNAKATKVVKEEIAVLGFPEIQLEIKELSSLDAPKGDVEEIDGIVKGIEEALKKAAANPASLITNGSSGPFTQVGKLARKYGFKACAFPI